MVNTRIYLFSMGAGRIYLGIFGRGDRLWFTSGFCRTTRGCRGAGFFIPTTFLHILLPQGLANARQPIVGQYLNLMKLSSLASGIGFAELTYGTAN